MTHYDHHSRLLDLRAQLNERSLDGFIQPMTDPFMGEYVPACYQRLPWLTGFTGSAGSVVVLADKAAVFSDGRYTLQLQQEVDAADYTCLDSSEVSPEQWVVNESGEGAKIGYDPWLFTSGRLKQIQSALATQDIELVAQDSNPIDTLWQDRPAAPDAPLRVHPLEFAGQASADKRQQLAAQLVGEACDALLLTASDSIAWLLNIRGDDVPHTPVALVYAVLYADASVDLFINESRVPEDVRQHLGDDVRILSPDALTASLGAMGGKQLWLDSSSAPVWFTQTLEAANATLHTATDPCQLPKACKNAVEVEGMRDAHIRDGVSVCRFLHWLEQALERGETITEMGAAHKLEHFRREDNLLTDLSFTTISGYGSNGAIVHYRAQEHTNQTLKAGNLFLLDSGGQYQNGTTDITRTLAIGTPLAEHKDRFTCVLKGHIALAMAQFPKGSTGSHLDTLARMPLWQQGLDYNHGTGHGVGSYLGVHEGPQGISKRHSSVPLQPGMILSNEPGYYKTGEYGIRIENLVTVVAAETDTADTPPFYHFETLTLVPIDQRLIDTSLLNTDEIKWLNRYHQQVYETISPRLDAPVASWLRSQTVPLS